LNDEQRIVDSAGGRMEASPAAWPDSMTRGNPESTPAGPVAYILKMFPRLSETFITNELRELRRHGVDVRIVSLLRPAGAIISSQAAPLADSAHYLPSLHESSGRKELLSSHLRLLRKNPARYLHTLALVAKRFRTTAWKRFFQGGGLAKICLEENVSHIHAGFAHTPTSVAVWTHRLTGIPYSFAAHAKDLYLSERKSLIHKMERARFVWTCTEANGRHLRSLGTSTPVHVKYHGIDLSFFTPPAGTGDGGDGVSRILAVGRHVPKKGLDDLIRAAGILRERGRDNFEVVFVGDGPERKALENLSREMKLNDRIRFLGSMSPEDVRNEYRRADVVVLPSVLLENGDRDGIPNVLVEAMAMGVPVVSTRISAIPELVRDRETGFLVDERSPEQLADRIEEVIRTPQQTRDIACRAREDVEGRFNLQENSKTLADLLSRHQRPTRCLYVSADMGVPIRGHKGASSHVRQVSRNLARAGLQVHIITPSPGPEPPEGNTFDLPIEVVSPSPRVTRFMGRLPKGRAREIVREFRRLLYNVPLARRVGDLLKEQRPDFVYERYSLCAIATGILCRRRRIPWAVEVNAPLADEERDYRTLRLGWLTRLLERWVLRHADHLFVVSHPLKRWALGQGVRPDRVTVLPNGFDSDHFRRGLDASAVRARWGWTGEEVIVGFSGSLKPWHGVGVLLDALRKALEVNPMLRLVYIGDGPERKALGKKVRKHGLEDVVRFTGAVPQNEVPLLLRATNVLAAPYLPQEPFYFSPLKVIESMAVGRPVIASGLGDIPDLIDDRCGRLVPPGQSGPLTDAILELAADLELRRRLGHAAGREARGHDWSSRVEEILTTMEEIRGTRSARLRLRVGYVLKMFPRFSETFVVNEILELERMDTEVRVFSMKTPRGPRQRGSERVRARVDVLPAPSEILKPRCFLAHARCLLRSPRRYFGALSFAITRKDRRALDKFLQAGVVADAGTREGIHHLHAHFASGPTRVAKMASMISGIPFSFTAHAKDLYWQGHRHNESHKLKKRVKLCRFVVAISEENKRFLEGLGFKVKEGRVRPVYIGLRLQEFPFRKPSERSRGPRPVILAVGRLIEKKGFHVLIEALAELRDRGESFRCFIAGDGPERESLERLITEKSLKGHVRLLGDVPLERLRRQYYRRASVMAQPCVVASDGDRDGIPTVLIEAMAMGVPVISTRVSGIPEAITDGVNGFLTDPGDVSLLADRIQAVISDSSLSDRLALEARNRVEQQFDQWKNAGILRKLFLRSARGWPPREVPAGDSSESQSTRERSAGGRAAGAESPVGDDAGVPLGASSSSPGS
jgi:glycosyltransferase involved in cell wall biosynthesis